jgi:hypothetical protein
VRRQLAPRLGMVDMSSADRVVWDWLRARSVWQAEQVLAGRLAAGDCSSPPPGMGLFQGSCPGGFCVIAGKPDVNCWKGRICYLVGKQVAAFDHTELPS